MSFKSDLRQLLKPYYWLNILLSVFYVVSKKVPVLHRFLHPDSDGELDSHETEILFFLIIVVMLRTKKAGSVTMINYLTSSFVYTKIANLILWFYADVRYGLFFGALFVLVSLLFPEPTYTGPENIIYFRGLKSLEEEVSRGGGAWLVCVYAAWHPACATLAPVFAELSAEYHGPGLRFGKLDAGRYPEAARRFNVADGPTSRQLPTLLLLRGGRELLRRPDADAAGKLRKFHFSKDNIKAAFDLDGLYRAGADKTDDKQTQKEDKKSQ